MTISVLMSTYANEKPAYLDAALSSIWTEQLRRPDEIVLVKDGPLTPELDATIDKWAQLIGSPLVILVHEKNRGLAAALNTGIEVAKSDLIARMDSDDISTPYRLEVQETYMMKHPEVDILGGSLEEFNDAGTLHNVCAYPQSREEVERHIIVASPLGHPCVMFRRRFFDEGFRYSYSYPLCEDIALWFDAVCSGHVINNIPDVVLHFRRNSSTLRRRSHEKAWTEFNVYIRGTNRLHGWWSKGYLYAVARLLFRLMPVCITEWVYNSKLRIHIRS